MATGECMRCGGIGPIELDHPDGRHVGKPLMPDVVVPLCKPCHHLKGVMDRAANVEGGDPTMRQVVARRAAGMEFFASIGKPILVQPWFFAGLAKMLAYIARCIPPHWRWTTEE